MGCGHDTDVEGLTTDEPILSRLVATSVRGLAKPPDDRVVLEVRELSFARTVPVSFDRRREVRRQG
jgi:hypothetical protein